MRISMATITAAPRAAMRASRVWTNHAHCRSLSVVMPHRALLLSLPLCRRVP